MKSGIHTIDSRDGKYRLEAHFTATDPLNGTIDAPPEPSVVEITRVDLIDLPNGKPSASIDILGNGFLADLDDFLAWIYEEVYENLSV
jgi:hypothetical protein